MKHKEERMGELVMIGELLLHGAVPVALNYGAKLVPQLYFIAWITLFGALLYVFTTVWRASKWRAVSLVDLRDLTLYTFLIAVIPYGLVTYMTKFTDAISTTLFMQTELVFAFLVGWLLLKERLGVYRILGMISILGGNLFVLFNSGLEFSWPGLIMALSTVFFAFGNMVAKNMQARGIDWSVILLYRHALGAAVLFGVARLLDPFYLPVDMSMWMLLAVLGMGVFGLGKILWQVALNRLDLSKVTAIGMTSPVVSLLLAFVLLKEVPSGFQWLGIVFNLLGVGFILQTKSKQWLED